jgi:hypothetical protein
VIIRIFVDGERSAVLAHERSHGVLGIALFPRDAKGDEVLFIVCVSLACGAKKIRSRWFHMELRCAF